MTQSDYTTSIIVTKSPKEVYHAINNVRGWWSEEIEGSTDKLNAVWNYHYQDVHRCKMKIIELVPGQRVVWEVVDNYFSFTKDKKEWTGNTIVFDITEKDNATHLQVTQIGLVPEYECYDVCENAWNTYIQKSLYNLITTGKGQPNSSEKPQTDDERKLSTAGFTTTFFVDQTPHEVFTAINNVRGWWQGEVTGGTDKLNDEFDYRMEDIHYSRQKLVEVIPDKRVVWSVTDSQLSFIEDKDEWTNTRIIFDITEINNKTQVRFTHIGLLPAIECYDACSNAWQQLIQESLVRLITTGKGKKVFG